MTIPIETVGEVPIDSRIHLLEELEADDIEEILLDFDNEEMVIRFNPHKFVVLDFDEFFVHEIDGGTYDANYGNEKHSLPHHLQKQMEVIDQNTKNQFQIIGDGYFRFLSIKRFNAYIIIGKILVDQEDFPPDDDPDGGEPVPVPEGTGFSILKNPEYNKVIPEVIYVKTPGQAGGFLMHIFYNTFLLPQGVF